MPAPRMIVRTSAKSRLISPGQGDHVADALDALAQQVVGHLERVTMLVPRSSTAIRRSFGMMITVSAAAWSRARPSSAIRVRRLPSNAKGRVTTATVSAPSSRAIFATAGAARAGAAALAGRDEHQVAAAQRAAHLLLALAQGLLAQRQVAAGAEPAGELHADGDADVGLALLERLAVGVDGDELHAPQPGLDHAVDRVAARAAHADDADHRDVVGPSDAGRRSDSRRAPRDGRVGVGGAEELGQRPLAHAGRPPRVLTPPPSPRPPAPRRRAASATSRASWRYQRAAWPPGS